MNTFPDIFKLIYFATLIAVFFLFSANYFYDNDSTLFMSYANALLKGHDYLNSQAVVRYDIAYPVLLILSGYSLHHSLIGIALINMIMAISMPVLIYLMVKPAFPKGAYYIALAAIFSLSPFYYIKWVRPDHASMFFSCLSMCLLSFFIDTKRPVFLYAMIGAVIIASLLRSAGIILFPFFLSMAFLFVRGSWGKYIISILIGLCVFSCYFHFKNQFFSKFGERTSFNGGQTFQNLYINSKEFGIHLSPELGPAMKMISENLYRALLPKPDLSSLIKPQKNTLESLTTYSGEPNFLTSYVYPFSAKEFIKQIYEAPCWEYNYMLYIATPNDSLFLKASWEIIRHYPWYPFAYTVRNIWYFLYNPGFEHLRYTVAPLQGSNIQDAFPFDAITHTSLNLSERAAHEIEFDTLEHKPQSIVHIIHSIKLYFSLHYLKYTRIIFYLMTIAWIVILLDLFVDGLLPNKAKPIGIILSLYLFLNMLIPSVFVDPLLRYHNHLIPFKIMLAGLGAGIFFHVVRRVLWRKSYASD